MNEISKYRNSESRMRKWGMKEEWEVGGKSDGCDRRVSVACDAWIEVDYSDPCGC